MSEPPVHVTTDEVHAHPRHTGRPWLDLAIALSAIFISAVSLFVAIEHGKTERDLVAANSWPFLREVRTNNYDSEQNLALGYSNGGVGPAKVETFEVFYRGRAVASGLDLLRKCCGLGPGLDAVKRQMPRGFAYSTAEDTVLRPGETNDVLLVRRTPGVPELPARFDAALPDITFRACYCSILDECWVSDLRSTRTRQVKICPAPQVPYVANGD